MCQWGRREDRSTCQATVKRKREETTCRDFNLPQEQQSERKHVQEDVFDRGLVCVCLAMAWLVWEKGGGDPRVAAFFLAREAAHRTSRAERETHSNTQLTLSPSL